METESHQNAAGSTSSPTLPTFSMAVKAFTEGRFSDAETHCHQAMETDTVPKPEGYLLLGMIAQRRGDQPSAMQCFEKTIEFDPNNPDYYTVLGDVYLAMGRDEAALKVFRQGMVLEPTNAFLHERLGTVLFTHNRDDEALFHLREAVRLAPEEGKPYYSLANALRKVQPHEAVELYLDAIKYSPDNADAYFELGNTLQQLYNQQQSLENTGGNQSQDYLEQAANVYQECIRLNPDHADAYYNLGNAYLKLERVGQAEAAYRQAVQLDPNNALGFNNLGIVLRCQLRLDEAMAAYREAIAIDPEFIDAHHNLGVIQLMKGQLGEAWSEYEWRTRKNIYDRGTQTPYWKGESLADKTLVVWAEGGYGDTFQFLRFLPQVKAQAGKVVFVAQTGLSRLLQSVLEKNGWVDEYREYGKDENLETVLQQLRQTGSVDYYVGTMSLPALFKTEQSTIPSQHPYIPAPMDLVSAWRDKISGAKLLKVGIAWAGTVTVPSVLKRACPLNAFFPLASQEGVRLFSLQVGRGREELDAAMAEEVAIVPLSDGFQDFADTAAAIEALDLVITVDTGVAHLAAAMGKPVWMLLPFSPDWRWMTEREDTPWYPTLRLFRQPVLGDWASVFQDVQTALKTFQSNT